MLNPSWDVGAGSGELAGGDHCLGGSAEYEGGDEAGGVAGCGRRH